MFRLLETLSATEKQALKELWEPRFGLVPAYLIDVEFRCGGGAVFATGSHFQRSDFWSEYGEIMIRWMLLLFYPESELDQPPVLARWREFSGAMPWGDSSESRAVRAIGA